MQAKHSRRCCSFEQTTNKQIKSPEATRTLCWRVDLKLRRPDPNDAQGLEKGWLGRVEDTRVLHSRVYFKIATHKTAQAFSALEDPDVTWLTRITSFGELFGFGIGYKGSF